MLSRIIIKRALLQRCLKNAPENLKQAKRHGHGTWSYRMPPPLPPKRSVLLAEGIGAAVWGWIFWHIFTEPEHVYGEWPWQNPRHWTDEELGIPPDSEGHLKKKPEFLEN